jgi:hypothetical protein
MIDTGVAQLLSAFQLRARNETIKGAAKDAANFDGYSFQEFFQAVHDYKQANLLALEGIYAFCPATLHAWYPFQVFRRDYYKFRENEPFEGHLSPRVAEPILRKIAPQLIRRAAVIPASVPIVQPQRPAEPVPASSPPSTNKRGSYPKQPFFNFLVNVLHIAEHDIGPVYANLSGHAQTKYPQDWLLQDFVHYKNAKEIGGYIGVEVAQEIAAVCQRMKGYGVGDASEEPVVSSPRKRAADAIGDGGVAFKADLFEYMVEEGAHLDEDLPRIYAHLCEEVTAQYPLATALKNARDYMKDRYVRGLVPQDVCDSILHVWNNREIYFRPVMRVVLEKESNLPVGAEIVRPVYEPLVVENGKVFSSQFVPIFRAEQRRTGLGAHSVWPAVEAEVGSSYSLQGYLCVASGSAKTIPESAARTVLEVYSKIPSLREPVRIEEALTVNELSGLVDAKAHYGLAFQQLRDARIAVGLNATTAIRRVANLLEISEINAKHLFIKDQNDDRKVSRLRVGIALAALAGHEIPQEVLDAQKEKRRAPRKPKDSIDADGVAALADQLLLSFDRAQITVDDVFDCIDLDGDTPLTRDEVGGWFDGTSGAVKKARIGPFMAAAVGLLERQVATPHQTWLLNYPPAPLPTPSHH